MTAARPLPSRRHLGPPPGGVDRGSIVLGWLVKLTVALAVLGVLLFDGIAVGVARVSASDAAKVAADAGQQSFFERGPDGARQAATQAAANAGTTLVSFSVVADGTTEVTVSRTVDTLVFQHLPMTRGLLTARATAVQKPPAP